MKKLQQRTDEAAAEVSKATDETIDSATGRQRSCRAVILLLED